MSTLSVQLKKAFLEMKETPQRIDYHPEKWVWEHTAYVYFGVISNLTEKYNEQEIEELKLTALFHDLGKIDTTWFREDRGYLVSYGHEKAAFPYYDSVKSYFSSVREDIVRWLVRNHMKAKFMDNMNESTIKDLKEEADDLSRGETDVWEMLLDFNSQDDMRSFFKETNEETRLEAEYRFNSYFNEVLEIVKRHSKVDISDQNGDLILVRGVPGSGKSTAAEAIVESGGKMVAADDFFVGDDGKYRYDGSKIGDAHDWCREKVVNMIENGVSKIVVHNTFTKRWEMMGYFRIASDYGYRVHSLISENRHGSKNIHDVPENKVKEKQDKFEVQLN